MKSRDRTDMLRTWHAALLDAAAQCAIPVSAIARDIERVRKGFSTRGIAFFTLDLPLLDETLLSLLENGFAHFNGALRRRRSKRDSRPAFLNAFWRLVCDADGCLKKDADPTSILAIRQLSCFYKKLEVSCSEARTAKAVREFYEIESQIPPQPTRWYEDAYNPHDSVGYRDAFSVSDQDDLFGGRSGTEAKRIGFLERLDRVAGILASGLGVFDPMSDCSPEHGYFKHGPGATSNLKGSSYKYDFPSWPDKLAGLFDFGWSVGQLDAIPPSRSEAPSNLLAVPKTAKSPRLIASEPVEHQWCQQKVYTWLDGAIRSSLAGLFINLHDQTLSQRLVVKASMDQSLCTIDLSSASDRVTCQHVESLLRANHTVLVAAHAVRTRYVRDRVTSSGFHRLRKYSTMGSALTFPLQCLFFLAVTLASAGAYDKRSIVALKGKVRIFGDDIIAPNNAFDQIVDNLTFLGLKVNEKKSFSKGLFRESCGADYWGGFNVTPVKPKVILARSPVSCEAVRDTSNNFHKEGWWRVSNLLADSIPKRWRPSIDGRFRVVNGQTVGPGDPVFNAFVPASVPRAKWDAKLHKWYVPVPKAVQLDERVKQDGSTMLREFFARPYSAEKPRELGIVRRRTAKVAVCRVEVIPLENGAFAIF